MKILLINPNRYKYPPVIPAGIEYIIGSLSSSKHEYAVIDLCFSINPKQDLINRIKSYKLGIMCDLDYKSLNYRLSDYSTI